MAGSSSEAEGRREETERIHVGATETSSPVQDALSAAPRGAVLLCLLR